MVTVLVTGFEPFGGEAINPSGEAVGRLDGRLIGDAHVVARVLPATFAGSGPALVQAIDEIGPDLVIAVGQADGRMALSLERVAINVQDARIPDNDGASPVDEPVVPGGPAAYWTSLPIKAMAAALRQEGIPAEVSQTAGTFVCNHLFYSLAHLIATQRPGLRGGFIHIPLLPEQAARNPVKYGSMSLATIIAGLEIAVAAAVANVRDIKASDGAIS